MGTSTTHIHVKGNTFTGSRSAAASLTTVPGTSLCLSFTDNQSSPIQIYPILAGPPLGAYQFVNGGGRFDLEPLSGNIGLFDYTGAIYPVPKGTCD